VAEVKEMKSNEELKKLLHAHRTLSLIRNQNELSPNDDALLRGAIDQIFKVLQANGAKLLRIKNNWTNGEEWPDTDRGIIESYK
jgi:hypothetical protein